MGLTVMVVQGVGIPVVTLTVMAVQGVYQWCIPSLTVILRILKRIF